MRISFVRAVVVVLAAFTSFAIAQEPAKPTDADMAAGLARAQEVGREKPEFVKTLQGLAAGFQTVEVNATPGQTTWQRVTLNRLGKRVDAIRFRTPAVGPKAKLNDMTWAFAFPAKSVDVWYIAPVTGAMQGFQNFFPLRRETLTTVGEAPAEHEVIAQRLAATRLKPDTEYVLWFTFKDERPAELHVAINFVPTKGQSQKATTEALGIGEKAK